MQTRGSAFNGTNSAGVRVPWRRGNLNNTSNAGLACENGNNNPSNSNWNGAPRLNHIKAERLKCVCISFGDGHKISKTEAVSKTGVQLQAACAASSNKAHPALWVKQGWPQPKSALL